MKVSQPPIRTKPMMDAEFDINNVDVEIRPIVQLLRGKKFPTYSSCAGGVGHAFSRPNVHITTNKEVVLDQVSRVYEVMREAGYRFFHLQIHCHMGVPNSIEVYWPSLNAMFYEIEHPKA